MKRKYDVIVVGGGASGMMAAISAARVGAKTAILEHMEQPGKKILATGNGKCNFTNQAQGVEYYRGQNPAFVLPIFEQFDLSKTLAFFEELGVFPKEKHGGCYYPASEQASALRGAMVSELTRLKVDCYCSIGIRSIQKKQESFFFDTKQGIYESRSCVIATGGKAAKKTGSDGSGIPYVVGFGHKVTDFVPALVQLQGKQSFLKEVAGIRADARITLYVNRTKTAEDTGQIQLTDFGVSGIPTFQISHDAVYALREGKQVYVTIDFAPDKTHWQLTNYFKRQCARWPECELSVSMVGWLNAKLIPVLIREAQLSHKQTLKQCDAKEFERLVSVLKAFRIDIIGNKSFDAAQVCAGGVDTSQIDGRTMESKLVAGLFFAGEVVDIDGICGGYNLQWAWSSGWVAGYHGGRL